MLDQAVSNAVDVLNHYPGPIMIACAIVGTGAMWYAVMRWKERQLPENKEAEMKRRAKLDEMYAERFGDVLFKAYINGEITGKEYRRDCRRFHIAYRFPFTLTFRNKKRVQKAKVEKNCAEMHRSPSSANKIPGPKPGDNVVVMAVSKHASRKVWLVPAKLRRKSA